MTDLIEFRDEEFSFRHNGALYEVHTEVGDNKPARVVVKETSEQDQQDMEWSDS